MSRFSVPTSRRRPGGSLRPWIALASLALAACPSGESEPQAESTAILDCEPKGNARPICGFQNPEDLVPLPGDEALVVSEYGAVEGGRAGRLVLYVLADDDRRVLFEGGTTGQPEETGWGDPACTAAPDARFSPHGIDLVRREDGRLQLLVVQHGDREAIEHFEVLGAGAEWRLVWRGCTPAPDDASLNEVVGLPDGRVYATKMMSLSADAEEIFRLVEEPTGEAWAWTPGEGWAPIPGTAGRMPNGIAASPDGEIVYMNASGENVIRKVEVATGRELGRAAVVSPDNVTWAPDGRRLLIASLLVTDPAEFESCRNLVTGACPIGFAIVAVEAESMEGLGEVYRSTGAPMGAGTVGLQVGDELFMGSFAGDRILRADLGSTSP